MMRSWLFCVKFLRADSKKRQANTSNIGSGYQIDLPDVNDHYTMLGLSFGATESAIKKAYKALAREYHPDRTQGDEAKTEKFKAINGAFHALPDEVVKQAYVVKKAYDAMCQAKAQHGDEGRNKRWKATGALPSHGPVTDDNCTSAVRHYEDEIARMRQVQSSIPSASSAHNSREARRPNVLLVDEVDVFFGNGFYGQPWRPSVNIDTHEGDAYNLLLHIWQKRDDYQKRGQTAFETTVQSRQELKNLQAVFPNFSGDILKRSSTKILPTKSACKYSKFQCCD